MGKTYSNAITTTAGFNYEARQPLDDREVVDSYSDLNGLINSGIAYEGMEVYVVADKKSYKLIGTAWKATAVVADIPTTLAALASDATHRVVTDDEKSSWNAKSNFSGNYDDLINKPTLTQIKFVTWKDSDL